MNLKLDWWLYIILTEKNRFYTGISLDPKRRFEQHRKKRGAKFFYTDTPLKIVYLENCKSHSLALKRERAIKKWTRKRKENLVNQAQSIQSLLSER